MLRNYYKYLPWLILAAFVSYGGATHYAQTTFDLFYLTAIFMIVYVALLYLHEHYLKYGNYIPVYTTNNILYL